MNTAVERAERGDYKGFWEVCEMFPDDWLTAYWKAVCWFEGYGCEKNQTKGWQIACELLSVVEGLAENDDSVAQFKLGAMYANGLGVEKDDELAVAWYRKAAEQGYPRAQRNLGFDLDLSGSTYNGR